MKHLVSTFIGIFLFFTASFAQVSDVEKTMSQGTKNGLSLDIKNVTLKSVEKDWKKFLEISDIYISFSNMADREEIKIDKYIESIDSVTAGQIEGAKEEKSKAIIKFYVISQDFNLHNLVFSIVYTNRKSKRLYFSKVQVIELQNRINKDNIIGAIYDNSAANEGINP